jgi:hypothetical protein
MGLHILFRFDLLIKLENKIREKKIMKILYKTKGLEVKKSMMLVLVIIFHIAPQALLIFCGLLFLLSIND